MAPDSSAPWHLPPGRRTRRVLLALLSGAGNLDGYRIGMLAQVWSGTSYPVLARLVKHGWALRTWENLPAGSSRQPRCLYRLTPAGRAGVLKLLKLEEG